jgi:hypothetical protein
MFGANHYVPIVRWKRAEKIALRHLQPADRPVMTPLNRTRSSQLQTRAGRVGGSSFDSGT